QPCHDDAVADRNGRDAVLTLCVRHAAARGALHQNDDVGEWGAASSRANGPFDRARVLCLEHGSREQQDDERAYEAASQIRRAYHISSPCGVISNQGGRSEATRAV